MPDTLAATVAAVAALSAKSLGIACQEHEYLLHGGHSANIARRALTLAESLR